MVAEGRGLRPSSNNSIKINSFRAVSVNDVATIDVVADRGYFKIEDLEACEKAGVTPHVPKPQRGSSVREGFFRKDEFCYDPERDVFICPAGQVLSSRYESRLRDLKKIDYANRAAMPGLSDPVALHQRLS
jgi:hypothetical protein